MGGGHAEIDIKDLVVPAANLLGGEGNGFNMGQHRLAYGRLRHGMHNVAMAQRALDMAAAHVTKRETFGKPLHERQAVQFMLADMFMQHQVGQTYAHQMAWKAEHGLLARHESYITKIFCTELGFKAADRCMQIHGGMGLTLETPIHKMWKDSRSFMITEGPVEIMRMVLSREIFRQYS
jgi:acyl-CoA dehydrogenase